MTAVMQNTDTLALVVADFHGIQPLALEKALSDKTKMVKEFCPVFLDLTLLRLYTLLFTWLNKHINQHLCRDDFDTFIRFFNLPEPQNMTVTPILFTSFVSTLQMSVYTISSSTTYSRYMWTNTKAKAWPPLFPPSPTSTILNVFIFSKTDLVGSFISWMTRPINHKKMDHTMTEVFGKR